MEHIDRIKRQVTRTLGSCAHDLAKERISRGGFWDRFIESDLQKRKPRTFVATCEGLETILQIGLYTPGFSITRFISDNPKVVQALCSDINWLLSEVRGESFEFYSGAPYYGRFGKGPHSPDNSIDSLAFFIAVCVHILAWHDELKLNDMGLSISEIEDALSRSVTKLISSTEKTIGRGWSDKVAEATPDIYTTWSVIETIEELRYFRPEEYRRIEETDILSSTGKWLEDQLNNTFEIVAKILDEPPREKDIEANPALCRGLASLHHFLQIITSLAILSKGKARELGRHISLIMNQKPLIIHNSFPALYKNMVYDYTLVPLTLRCLSRTFQCFPEGSVGSQEFKLGIGEIRKNKDTILFDLFRKIIEDKRILRRDEFLNLFWEPDQKSLHAGEFEIYYTERVTESLISYLEYLGNNNVEKNFERDPVVRSIPTKTRVDISVPVPRLATLEALDYYTETMLNNHGSIFKDCIIILLQHFLDDLPPFIEQAINLGAKGRDIYLLRKTYAYPQGDAIERYIKSQYGCHVEHQDVIFQKAMASRRRLLEKAFKKIESRPERKLIIIEDGGYFVPLLHDEYQAKIRNCLGSVEQTTRGIMNVQELHKQKKLKTPIINVARSTLKAEMESPEVADTLATNIKNICNSVSFYPKYTTILILGYGTIGSALTDSLLARGYSVSIYDKKARAIEQAERDNRRRGNKAEVIRKLKKEKLQEFKFIIGATGRPSISELDFLHLKNNVILASGSSERYEIDLESLERLVEKPITKNIKKDKKKLITTYKLVNGNNIRLLCDGEPINFPLSGGIPSIAIEPVLMQLISGAVKLVVEKDRLKSGIKKFPINEERKIKEIFKAMQ